ncbi:hypothetical protein [Chamaesiphon sp. VAR_69_metabat_338]|nr:hypothetical protein [Chamaesiphon sp. VAR_69_metabat_338]
MPLTYNRNIQATATAVVMTFGLEKMTLTATKMMRSVSIYKFSPIRSVDS